MNNTPSEPAESQTRPAELSDILTGFPGAVPSVAGSASVPQRIGDFTIVRVIGEGGMGTVYLAEDVRLGRQAAIKTMKLTLAAKPENRVRFVREARAAAAVEHDNIVPVWQVGEAADGSPFIAMPFLQGETLEARLKREPIAPLGIILKVAREVGEGLAAAHARGLIHRDVKPGNVWIEGEPEAGDLARQVRRCKILDFGLARVVGTEDAQLTASGTILGSPAYMAPEQAVGEKVDYRADLFSLGALLYRMATGRLPFAGSNTMAVLSALATVTPPPARKLNSNVPQSLSNLIDRLLCKDPSRRPQSAGEVVTTVRKIGQELPANKSALAESADDTVALESEPTPKPVPKLGRGRALLLAAVGLLILLPLGWWLAAVILRVETPNGTLIVEIDDAETEARVRDGKVILTGPDDKVRYTLAASERDKKIDAGPYKVRVEGADGLTLYTTEFTLKKGDKVTVRVTVDPKVVAKNLDADRKAAEWVLSVGGTVKVHGLDREIKAVGDLPAGACRLLVVDLHKNKQVSNAGLAHFKDCKNLEVLNLGETGVSDADLANFKDCKNFTVLWLYGTQVGDAGLAHFKDCKNLTLLGLGGTQVGDAGLAHFKDCKNLTSLGLRNTQVTDKGLALFKDYKNLALLYLEGTRVSDAGLASFKDCKNLQELWLQNTRVSDAGLAPFKDHMNFTYLDLRKTEVTAAKVEEFHKALPKCKIEWDGGVIEP